MKKINVQASEVKPFLSIFIVVVTMFSIVFCEMETREVGYFLLKENKKLDNLKRDYRKKNLTLAKINRPSRIRTLAMTKLTLRKIDRGQVIQINGNRVALIH